MIGNFWMLDIPKILLFGACCWPSFFWISAICEFSLGHLPAKSAHLMKFLRMAGVGSWTSFDDTPKSTGDSNNPPTPPGSFIPRYFECSPGAKKPHINEDYLFHNEGYGHLNENIRTSLFGRHNMLSWWWLFVLQWRRITHQKTVVSVLLSNSLRIRKMNSSQWMITETKQPSSFCPISSLNLILMLLCIRCFR